MSIGKFYQAPALEVLAEIIPVYQSAFAGDPWYEVSKCVDDTQRCSGGLSAVAVGSMCEMCGACPIETAYPAEELLTKFEEMGSYALNPDRRYAPMWYVERVDEELAMAALAYGDRMSVIAEAKYADNPEMQSWLMERFGNPMLRIGWLDEVFADTSVRENGNLRNFKYMCDWLTNQWALEVLLYRTINPKMIAAAQRDYGSQVTVYDAGDCPDRRGFVIIRPRGGQVNQKLGAELEVKRKPKDSQSAPTTALKARAYRQPISQEPGGSNPLGSYGYWEREGDAEPISQDPGGGSPLGSSYPQNDGSRKTFSIDPVEGWW